MRAGRQLRAAFIALVTIQVLTSLAGIALLARMGPAIAAVLAENEGSLEAAEEMLAILAARAVAPEERRRYYDRLAVAEREVTEPGEARLLATVRRSSDRALAGDPDARQAVVSALREVSAMNRDAMRRADTRVRRIGLAGRWALAILALIGLLGSALAMRRARRKVLTPVAELVSVLRARAAGERHRRYLHQPDSELAGLLVGINDLLDEVDRAQAPRGRVEATTLRAAMGRLLDRIGGRVVLVDEAGQLVAASTEALDLLTERGDEVRAALRGEGRGAWAEGVEELARTPLSLVTLRPAPVAP